MNELAEGRKLNQFSMRQAFKATLIYGLISFTTLPTRVFYTDSVFDFITPVLVGFTQFLDIRTRPQNTGRYIKVLMGLVIYVIAMYFFLPVLEQFFPLGQPRPIYSYFIAWLVPPVLGALILAATFPNALLRKSNGKRSVLFWLIMLVPILGFLGGFLGLGKFVMTVTGS